MLDEVRSVFARKLEGEISNLLWSASAAHRSAKERLDS